MMSDDRKILVIPSSSHAKKLISSLDLTCQCTILKTKISFRPKDLNYIIGEILLSTSYVKLYEVTFLKRLVFLCKLILKRPLLLLNIIFFAKTFLLSSKGSCNHHSISISDETLIWYSASATRQGFPWPHDSFLNSLKFIRDKNIKILVFGSETKFAESNILVDTLNIASGKANIGIRDINSWKNTKLQMVTDAEITHGSVLSKNCEVILQDTDLSFQHIPERMTPNHLWFKEMLSERIVLNTPKCNMDFLEVKSCIFINSVTDNFYHYMSESIRVLIMASEANIDVDNIVIRAGLPGQFYEVINEIYPNIPIIKAQKNQKIKAKKVIFAQYHDRLSLEKSLFRDMPLHLIQGSDEWRAWFWLRNRFFIDKDSEISLYLPRERYQSRGIANSRYLSQALLNKNFQILNTEHTSFYLQRSKFARSKIVCSTTGASLMNMIFMPKGATVLEITYPSGDSWEFMAKLCELNYIKLPIRSFLPQTLNESLDIYLAPVSRILKSTQELKD